MSMSSSFGLRHSFVIRHSRFAIFPTSHFSHQSRLIFYSQTDYDYEHEHEHEFFIRHPLATLPARETFGVASAKEDHLSAFPSPSSFPQP